MPPIRLQPNNHTTNQPRLHETRGHEGEGMRLKKVHATIPISREALYSARAMFDSRYNRKANITSTPATPEAWERYRAAVDGLAAFEAYEGSQYGGPDFGNEVPEPEPTLEFDYLETHEEWLTRCAALEEEKW